ncbi:uncharacterized protein [Rutidosis leptorrhynchoides]|uniref:uncharacterized protein n=1 Tax=Rutidosis leptorrhynchoides TaxID=125765 RepID=UPI003A9A4C51
MNQISIIALIETHLDGERAASLCNQIQYNGHARVDARGHSGGIWLYWKKNEVNVDILFYHHQHVTIKVSQSLTEPWLLADDFNETTSLSERHGGNQEMQRRCDQFKNCIENTSIIDLGYSGAKFTWSRGRESLETRKTARLDRGLRDSLWRTRFSDAFVQHLPAISSDHSPLLIKTNGLVSPTRGTKPFRFLSHEEFENFVKEKWRNDTPIVPFLKTFAEDLQEWNKTVFGNIFRKKGHLWSRIAGVQKTLVERSNKYLLRLEYRLRCELDKVLAEEEELWFKNLDWKLSAMGTETLLIFIPQRLFGESDLYKAADEPPPSINLPKNCFPPNLASDYEKLMRPFTTQDIKAIISSMSPYKTPGPDGFQVIFFQHHWDTIQKSFCETALKILHGQNIPEGLNETFLILIPKVDRPKMVSELDI